MGASYDVAIAGGGIVGAACAMECAAAGLKTVVVEPGPIGGGATASGMGHVVVMDDSRAQIALTLYSRTLWIEMRDRLPADVEYLHCGTLWVAADDEEMAEVHRKKRLYDGISVRTDVLDGRQLAEAEPHLRPRLAGALLVHDDSTVYPPCAARWFIGSTPVVRSAAAAITATGIRLVDGGFVSAGAVVNATGAW